MITKSLLLSLNKLSFILLNGRLHYGKCCSTLFVVIHVDDAPQARAQAAIAFEQGADGIFLINHVQSFHDLLEVYRAVRQDYPRRWIGINCFDLDAKEVFRAVGASVDGIWTDNAGIEEERPVQRYADAVLRIRREAGWPGLYFGGVAFKYQREVTDLENPARIAAWYMDVVTTSGPGTGARLAIASGITPENVNQFAGAHYFLVATGISRDFSHLDPGRVRALVERLCQII